MSRVLVTNDDRTVAVEVTRNEDGYAHAVCEAEDWATGAGRLVPLADVIDHAGTHVDRAHR